MGVSKVELAYDLLVILTLAYKKPNNAHNQRNRHNCTAYTTTDRKQKTRKQPETTLIPAKKLYPNPTPRVTRKKTDPVKQPSQTKLPPEERRKSKQKGANRTYSSFYYKTRLELHP